MISGTICCKIRSESLYFFLIQQVFLYNLRVVEGGKNKTRILLFGYQDWHTEYEIQYI